MSAELAEMSKYIYIRAYESSPMGNERHLLLSLYDDSDVEINGFDSDDEEVQQEYALQMSLAGSDTTASEGGDKIQRSEWTEDSWKSKCRVCPWYPEFPHK
jgi:hypothetical protein